MKEKVEIDKLKYEKEQVSLGMNLIAGADEVGRGPLAGPVVCAAVIMPLDDLIDGIELAHKLKEYNLGVKIIEQVEIIDDWFKNI